MLETLGEKAVAALAALAGTAITAVGLYLAGERSGKAQFITAASTAADLMLKQQGSIIDRQNRVIAGLEDRLEAVEAREHDCQANLSELREQLATFRVAAGFPPFQSKRPEGG